MQNPFTASLIHGALISAWRCLAYIFVLAAILTVVHFTCRVPEDVYRKLLHFVAFSSVIYLVLRGEGWQAEALVLFAFAVAVYPALSVLERWEQYSGLVAEKSEGEVKTSLVFFYLSQSALVLLACGLFKRPYIHVAATAAWGFGDTAAALIGGRFGTHPVKLPQADEHKTWEGSAAMFCAAYLASFISLALLSGYTVPVCAVLSAFAALAAAYTELVSRNGIDTVTVPAAAALILCLAALIK